MIIARVGTGDVILAADDIGLPGLVVARLPAILSVEANPSVIRTVPTSLMVIPLPDITTVALLTVTTAAIAFLAIAITAVVFLTIATAIVFLMVALSAVAFPAINPLPITCILIDLVSREAVLVIVVI